MLPPRPYPTLVKFFDAFHLTTAIAVRERRVVDLAFATHDAQKATATRDFGFTCLES